MVWKLLRQSLRKIKEAGEAAGGAPRRARRQSDKNGKVRKKDANCYILSIAMWK
jgi:hypothetical protein